MSAVRAETLDRPRRPRSRAVAPSPRAARSSARPLPQESAGPRARQRQTLRPRLRWPSALSIAVVGLTLVGATAVYVQGERITEQQTADALEAGLDRPRTAQRDLLVGLASAETPEAVAEVARRAGLVEPATVAAVPAVPIGPSPPRTAVDLG